MILLEKGSVLLTWLLNCFDSTVKIIFLGRRGGLSLQSLSLQKIIFSAHESRPEVCP
jgi:hypothetical protein